MPGLQLSRVKAPDQVGSSSGPGDSFGMMPTARVDRAPAPADRATSQPPASGGKRPGGIDPAMMPTPRVDRHPSSGAGGAPAAAQGAAPTPRVNRDHGRPASEMHGFEQKALRARSGDRRRAPQRAQCGGDNDAGVGGGGGANTADKPEWLRTESMVAGDGSESSEGERDARQPTGCRPDWLQQAPYPAPIPAGPARPAKPTRKPQWLESSSCSTLGGQLDAASTRGAPASSAASNAFQRSEEPSHEQHRRQPL